MKYSCDFVQSPATGDPNSGSCLSSCDATKRQEAINLAAEEAMKYAKSGRIHGMLYTNTSSGSKVIKNHTGNSVTEVRDELLKK